MPALPPILFRDERFVVLDKPAGLPVHPSRNATGPSVEDLFPLLSRRRAGPWLVHRLDTDTAGCLLIALRRAPLLAAQAEFAAGRVHKLYWAVVRGVPLAQAGSIDQPLARRQAGRLWHMAVDPAGQSATTHWRLMGVAEDEGSAWLELAPRTGRTQQVRAHCAALGHPVLGDRIYGGGPGSLLLLARGLALDLTPPIAATAPPPPHMLAALRACGLEALSR